MKFHINDGDMFWLDEKKNLHREDGPAYIGRDGSESWYVHGYHITNDVIAWMEDFAINQNWKEWSDADKVAFKLRF